VLSRRVLLSIFNPSPPCGSVADTDNAVPESPHALTVALTSARTSMGACMQRIGAGIEALAWAANRLLYAFFNTAWALVYYVVYWRKPAFAAVIVLAFGVDLLRFDRRRCERVASHVSSRRSQIIWSLALIALLAAIGALVVAFDLRSIASGAAYLHYEQAKLYTTPARAALVYILEFSGIGFAFVLQAFLSVRPPTGAEIARVPIRQQRFRQFWLLVVFVLMALGLALFRLFDLWATGSTINTSYQPGTNVAALLLYIVSPMFFAAAMKAWLTTVYVLEANRLNSTPN
jgi:hypothetical protein